MAKHLTQLMFAHEQAHQSASELMEQFNDVLINVSLPRRAGDLTDLKNLQNTITRLEREILPHLETEEQNLYPYLAAHVPKLEAVVKYLTAEHADIRERFLEICNLLDELSGSSGQLNREKIILKLQQTGTYLVFLFRNHLRAEREGLIGVAQETLKIEEQTEVLQLL